LSPKFLQEVWGLTYAHPKNETQKCKVSEDIAGVLSPQTRVIAFAWRNINSNKYANNLKKVKKNYKAMVQEEAMRFAQQFRR